MNSYYFPVLFTFEEWSERENDIEKKKNKLRKCQKRTVSE